LQDVGDPFQVLVIRSFFERWAPEVEQQQAHNDDRGYSTQEKNNDSSDHVHDSPLFFIRLGSVYDRRPVKPIRKTLNMSGGIPILAAVRSLIGKVDKALKEDRTQEWKTGHVLRATR
jgi:hypothetical protein